MNVEPFKGPGSTPSRRRFWDQVARAVSGSTKQAGRNVTVSEHQGQGTFINVADTSARRPPPGDCGGCVCIDTVTLATAGSGYNIGNVLSPLFGTLCPPADTFGFQLLVTNTDGSGAVIDFVIIPGLGYSTPPSNPITFAGGGGGGFTANCAFDCPPTTKPKPESITIELNSVVFDCGCIDNGNGTSRIVNDSSLNDNPQIWSKVDSCGGDAVWSIGVGSYPVFIHLYASSDCSGTDVGGVVNPSVVFFLKDGVYRLIALTVITTAGPSIIFDGTTTDLSIPIANTASCVSGVAHGGTATIT